MASDDAHPVFAQLGFAEFTDVFEKKHIKHIIPKSNVSGIYCLLVEDELYYIGKSLNISGRFIDHKRTHKNIHKFTYIECGCEKLDEFEQHCIHTADAAGLKILNVQYASHPICKTDFDDLMPISEQEEWFNGEIDYSDGVRKDESLNNNNIRVKGENRFNKFMSDKNRDYLIEVCAEYTINTIPSPFLTEHNYWGVSCLPSTARYKPGYKTTFCFNIFRVETCVMLYNPSADDAWMYLNVAKTVLIEEFKSAELFFSEYPDCEFLDVSYENAGYDHVTIAFNDLNKVHDALSDERIIKCARYFNLRLMRKGKNFFKQYHSFQLADKIFETIAKFYESAEGGSG